MKQTITRKGTFDAGHRVMFERVKCYNIHGHLYQYELTFEYEQIKDIGYAIDFKEIKRTACNYIDDRFDHGFIANPKDDVMVNACVETGSKMRFSPFVNEEGFCNPTAENISKDLFLSVTQLMSDYSNILKLKTVRLYETPNCFVDCFDYSISDQDYLNFNKMYGEDITAYRNKCGKFEYDSRLL